MAMSPTAKISDTEMQESSARRRKKMENPHTHYLKAVDSELVSDDGSKGKMVGLAHWNIYGAGITDDELQVLCTTYPPPKLELDEGTDEAFAVIAGRAWADFFDYLTTCRRRFFTRGPTAFLNLLVVHPTAHRRGAGTMLVGWGVEKADAMGLTGFLEASRMGAPLYRKFGFEPVHQQMFDLAVYGKEFEGVHDTNYIMIRPKKGEKLEHPTV